MLTYTNIKTGRVHMMRSQAQIDRFFDNRDPRDYVEDFVELDF